MTFTPAVAHIRAARQLGIPEWEYLRQIALGNRRCGGICQQWLPQDHFRKRSRTSPYFEGRCIACNRGQASNMGRRRVSDEQLEMFADRFSTLRSRHGLSQSEIARRLHCTTRAVGLWEAGERVPSSDSLADLADLLGVTMDYLWRGRGRR
jgi:DNA-binding transcriptional regulator YiaG